VVLEHLAERMVDEDAPVAEGGHLVDDRLHLLRREVTERQRNTTIGAEPHHVLDDRQEPAVIVEHVHAGLARFLPGERRQRLLFVLAAGMSVDVDRVRQIVHRRLVGAHAVAGLVGTDDSPADHRPSAFPGWMSLGSPGLYSHWRTSASGGGAWPRRAPSW